MTNQQEIGFNRISLAWALLHVVTYLFILFAFVFAINEFIGRINPDLFDFAGPYKACVSESVMLIASVAVMIAFLRKDTAKFFEDIGLRNKKAPLEVLCGFGIGIIVLGTMFGVMHLAGAYTVTSFNWPVDLLPALAIFFVAGFTEEIIFRGFIFRLLEKGGGVIAAIVFSSLFFGFAHMLNTSTQAPASYMLYACALLSFEAGLPLSGAFLITRSLWLPTGFHWAWNIMEGTVFGVPVSGTDPGPSILTSRIKDDLILGGGPFGPEGSMPFFTIGVLAGFFLLYFSRIKGKWYHEDES